METVVKPLAFIVYWAIWANWNALAIIFTIFNPTFVITSIFLSYFNLACLTLNTFNEWTYKVIVSISSSPLALSMPHFVKPLANICLSILFGKNTIRCFFTFNVCSYVSVSISISHFELAMVLVVKPSTNKLVAILFYKLTFSMLLVVKILFFFLTLKFNFLTFFGINTDLACKGF